jgi:hypothetical protein
MRRRLMLNSSNWNGQSFDYNEYMTVEALEDGVQVIMPQNTWYNIDGTGWVRLVFNTASPAISQGSRISFKFYSQYSYARWGIFGTIQLRGKCKIVGDVLALFTENKYLYPLPEDASELSQMMSGLFMDNEDLIETSSDLLRNITTVGPSMCEMMFSGCTNLVTAPALPPAKILSESCYSLMFASCKSLVDPPLGWGELQLAKSCCEGMFAECSKLRQSPILSCTDLVESCYKNMFVECTNLKSVTTHARDVSAPNCINNWLNGVSATGTFYISYYVNTSIYSRGPSGIPENWTITRMGDFEDDGEFN